MLILLVKETVITIIQQLDGDNDTMDEGDTCKSNNPGFHNFIFLIIFFLYSKLVCRMCTIDFLLSY